MLGLLACVSMAWAQSAPGATPTVSLTKPSPPSARWMAVPRITARLSASDLGLVINTADPYSVAVGEYYIKKRGIPLEQVLRVELPVKTQLTLLEFGDLYAQVRDFMGPQVQALALAWSQPYAVGCNAITSALTLGYDP